MQPPSTPPVSATRSSRAARSRELCASVLPGVKRFHRPVIGELTLTFETM